MNPRRFLNFFRSPTGALTLFLIGLLVVLLLVNSRRSSSKSASSDTDKDAPQHGGAAPQLPTTVLRDMVPFNATDREPKLQASPHPAAAKPQPTPPPLPPLSLVAETPAPPAKDAKTFSADFAPFGRLVPCELVVTVDSSAIQTPIIGLVTEDIFHHGQLIIPAGTEVHGSATVNRARERIASNGRWTLVWQSGEELNVSGLALDHEIEPDTGTWAITDGSAGLRGKLIKSDNLAEVKLFAAALLSGASEAFTEKRSSDYGSYALAALSGRARTHFKSSQVIEPGRMGFIASCVNCGGGGTGICADYVSELRQIVTEARTKRVDVLCLPELCVCPHGRGAIEEALKDTTTQPTRDVMLIIPGSFHEEVSASEPHVKSWENAAPIWRLRSGSVEPVTRVIKAEPYSFTDDSQNSTDLTLAELVQAGAAQGCRTYVEDVIAGTTTTLIQSPVGLWGVMICLDALYPHKNALDALSLLADHVLVISMGENGPEYYRSFATNQNKFHLGAVYYVNAAQRLSPPGSQQDELHAAFWPPFPMTPARAEPSATTQHTSSESNSR